MNIAILGATGYTGFELIKLILKHKNFNLTVLTSENYVGNKISDIFPTLKSLCDITLTSNNIDKIAERADAIFCCLPHSKAMTTVAELYERNKIVIDLSADFRVDDSDLYEKTYNVKHTEKQLLPTAVYGLVEIFRDTIKNSKLIASPGCYPTSIIVPLYPLIKECLIDSNNIIADSKSGVSGAGRKATLGNSFCEVNNSFMPYSIFKHRHNMEIDYILSKVGLDVRTIFTPHLLPIQRGILSTIYTKSNQPLEKLYACLRDHYNDDKLIRIKDNSSNIEIKHVANTSFIDIALYKKDDNVIIVSALDNLLKGASSQALQALNIITNNDEYEGIL